MRMSAEVELVVDAKATLGEGVIWHAAKACLYWVDIEAGLVHAFEPRTGRDRAFRVGTKVGSVVPRTRGGLMLAVKAGFASFDPDDGMLTVVAERETDIPANRFNDGKCDPAGRFWAGTMDEGLAAGRGSLYRLDADMSVHRMIEGVTISNGLAWSLDRRVFYYIDTSTRAVAAFDYDDATGAISGRREVVAVPEKLGYPDGMAIDAEGRLWVAHWGAGAVCRWNPDDGTLMERIDVPAAHASSCAFGGEDLCDLYITTARSGLSEAQLAEQPLAGGLFRARPGMKGVPAFEFAG
jgi:sugar lactone lactonase YvrE